VFKKDLSTCFQVVVDHVPYQVLLAINPDPLAHKGSEVNSVQAAIKGNVNAPVLEAFADHAVADACFQGNFLGAPLKDSCTYAVRACFQVLAAFGLEDYCIHPCLPEEVGQEQARWASAHNPHLYSTHLHLRTGPDRKGDVPLLPLLQARMGCAATEKRFPPFAR